MEIDSKALFNIGYGLYVVTTKDEVRDNGLIVNTVIQVTDTPKRVAVAVNKANYSCDIIEKTKMFNVNCLSEKAPFWVFEKFGFASGKDTDKFQDYKPIYSENSLAVLPEFINAFISVKVEQVIDLGTHKMFIGQVTQAEVKDDAPTMTYTYYQNNVKPKKEVSAKKGYVCKICGYVYEGETLPDDFVCPLCKHGAADFEPLS